MAPAPLALYAMLLINWHLVMTDGLVLVFLAASCNAIAPPFSWVAVLSINWHSVINNDLLDDHIEMYIAPPSP